MRIMTCNIWGDYFENPVEARMGGYETLFAEYVPDIVGLQECTLSWHNCDMFRKIADRYTMYATDNRNFTPLLLKKDRFYVLEYESLLYAETPDPSKGFNRLVLQDIESEKKFAVLNTHLWWKVGPEHDLIREKNARELSNAMLRTAEKFDCPVFAFGDFNSRYREVAFRVFEQNGIERCIDKALSADTVSTNHFDPIRGEDGRWHGKTTTNDKEESIDHIVMCHYADKIDAYRVITDQYILDSSDHSPVYIDVQI